MEERGREDGLSWSESDKSRSQLMLHRDYKRFPTQEKARGVIREIAGRILDSA